MKNHLIHIGYPKTGSTFLQEWFNQNPQISYSHGALAGFNDIFGIVRLAVNSKPNEYLCFVTSTETISIPQFEAGYIPVRHGKGVILPSDSIIEAQKNCCQLLKELFPNGKILIVTRGLRKMLFSGFSEFVKEGGVFSLNELTTDSIKDGFERAVFDIRSKFEINHCRKVFRRISPRDLRGCT